MGIRFADVKDCVFETEYFFGTALYEVNKKLNDFLKSGRANGKVIPINIAYDVKVVHDVGGPKNLMHTNHVEHCAILTYQLVAREYTFEENVERILETLWFAIRDDVVKQNYLNLGFTEEEYAEAERRLDERNAKNEPQN